MMRVLPVVLVVCGVLSACGSNGDSIDCDAGPYLTAQRTPKVEAPDGLDNLNPFSEMPLPQASPQESRPADGPCLEQPPQIIRMN